MVIVETPAFTRLVTATLDDPSYARLQVLLMLYLYPKSVRDRLTKNQEQSLATLAEREFG